MGFLRKLEKEANINLPDNQNPSPVAARNSEEIIFQEGTITISKLRFVVENQMFPISGITSVKFEKVSPDLLVSFVLFLAGAFFYISRLGIEPALVCIVVGILIAITRFGKFSVTLGTAGGEVRSYVSRDARFVEKIVAALNDAIVQHG